MSALTVVLGHVRNQMFAPDAGAGELGFLGKSFYFLTNFHFEAVKVFFVLT